MKNILLVTSSPRGEESYSQRVAREVVDDLVARNPGARVIVRDLTKQPLPHVGAAFAVGLALPLRSAVPKSASAGGVRGLIDELFAADAIVIAVPMHNFGSLRR